MDRRGSEYRGIMLHEAGILLDSGLALEQVGCGPGEEPEIQSHNNHLL